MSDMGNADITEFHKYDDDHMLVAEDKSRCSEKEIEKTQNEVDAYRKHFDELNLICKDMQIFSDAHKFDSYSFNG